MPLSETICIPASLSEFLHSTDLEYQQSLSLIPLFNPEVTKLWSKEQKRIFASILYHLRGHFINFGWYIANFCHEDTTKQIILNNIQEELGLG